MKVKLISGTQNPLDVMYTAARTCYSSKSPIELWDECENKTKEQKWKLIKQVLDSGHQSIAEQVYLSFAIEGISRACSHQLVRHRAGVVYCLDENTKIYRYNLNGVKEHTIKELYEKWHNPRYYHSMKLLKLRSVNENNIIVPNHVKNVIDCGVQPVYRVITSLGYTICCTRNHTFFNKEGEFRLRDLHVGDHVFVNGIELYKDKQWFTQKYCDEHLNTRQIAALCNIKPVTARVWKRKHGIKNDNSFKKRSFSVETRHKISEANRERIVEDSTRNLLSQQKLGGKNPQFKPLRDIGEGGLRKKHRNNKGSYCQLCGSTEHLHIHHIDKNVKNTHKSNALTVCASCHALLHSKKHAMKVIEDTITSITYIGEHHTYDLEMENPYHNFVADGFLVHNSQQSQRYVEIKEDFDTLIDLRDKQLQTTKDEEYLLNVCKKYIVIDENTNDYKDYLDALINYLYRIKIGMKAEDARNVLPNATKTNITMSLNLRELIHICNLRLCTRAQGEIRQLFTLIKEEVAEKYNARIADYLVPQCEIDGICHEAKCCGRKPKVSEIKSVYDALKKGTILQEDLESIKNPNVNENLKKLLETEILEETCSKSSRYS